VAQIRKMNTDGLSVYRIASKLNAEGVCTPYDKEFKTQTVLNILERLTHTSATLPSA
jgi:hypothetical protein